MEPSTEGAEILTEAYNLITGDRQHDYDHPLDDYSRTVDIFAAITGHNLTAEEGILFMVCVKLSRLMNEINRDLDVPDNGRDAAGYIGCLRMAIVERRRRAQVWKSDHPTYRFKTGESTWV